MNNIDNEQIINVAEYYGILLRHKWTFVLSFIIVLSFVLYYNTRLIPQYRAAATLIIDKSVGKPLLSREQLYYESYMSQSLTFNTHFELIKSRPVMETVIRKLKLNKDNDKKEKNKPAEINPIQKFFNQFKIDIFFLLEKRNKSTATTEDRLLGLVRSLQGMTKIEPVEDTRLLKIVVTNSSPEKARDVANAVAQSYIEFDISNRMTSSQTTLKWLTDHLYETTKKLEDAEAKFLTYKQNSKLVTMEDTQKMTAQKITEFNDAYIETRNKRLELDTKLDQLDQIAKSGKGIPHLSALIEKELINELYSQLVNAEVELSKLLKVYRSKHPKVIQAKTNASKIRNKIRLELKKEVENLKAERSILLARENVLQKTISDFENEAMETAKKELKYTMLKRNVEINSNLYNTLLARLKEADIGGSFDVSNIRIVGKATLPTYPVGTNKRRNIFMGIIIGLIVGIGLCFLQEYIDISLRTEDEVQKYLNVPVLSIIPFVEQTVVKSNKTNNDNDHGEVIT